MGTYTINGRPVSATRFWLVAAPVAALILGALALLFLPFLVLIGAFFIFAAGAFAVAYPYKLIKGHWPSWFQVEYSGKTAELVAGKTQNKGEPNAT